MNERSYNTVFETIVEDDTDLVGWVAYSLYKRNKRDWIIGFTETHGRPPNPNDVVSYVIGQKTPQTIELYRSKARDELGAYANYVVEAETPAIREAALSKEFLKRLDRMTHWFPAIVFSVAGAFVYTVILILLALVLRWVGVDLLSILAGMAR